jgi:hypothetical protein
VPTSSRLFDFYFEEGVHHKSLPLCIPPPCPPINGNSVVVTLCPQAHYRRSLHCRLVFKHLIQPWHPQSTLLHEAALAVKRLYGPEKYFQFSAALFLRQTEFFDANLWTKSRDEITAELVALAAEAVPKTAEDPKGVDPVELAALLALVPDTGDGTLNRGTQVTPILKLAVKEARQRGAHVSPTCAVNGIIVDSSSSWTVQQWVDFLGPFSK